MILYDIITLAGTGETVAHKGDNMTVNDLIKRQKKIRTVLIICSIIMLVLAILFLYQGISQDIDAKGRVIVCMLAAFIGACGCMRVNQDIINEENGIVMVQKIIDSSINYLNSITDETDAKLYTGLILTVMDHYLTPESNKELADIVAKYDFGEKNESPELVACGEKIVKLTMERFENPPAGGASKYFTLSENERELYNQLSRKIMGAESVDNRID